MVMNTFIQFINKSDYIQKGYHCLQFFTLRHWLQFADDAAAVTAIESDNQILLNAFSRWCQWSGMIIRVDKCHSFGIRKVGSKAKQIKPNLFINNQRVKSVEQSFMYLGRSFSFDMNSEYHKSNLTENLNKLLEMTSRLPLHPKHKLAIYQKYILSKISWDLTISDLPVT